MELLRQELEALTGHEVTIKINEVAVPDLNAQLVAERLRDSWNAVLVSTGHEKAMQNTMSGMPRNSHSRPVG